MKKYAFVIMVALLGISLFAFAGDETKQCTINVKGMTCGGCVNAVKSAVSKLQGVQSVAVSLEQGRAEVAYLEGKVSPTALVSAINASGFSAALVQAEEKKYPIDITKEMNLPEGATCLVTNEYDCPVPGYSKVKVVTLNLKPGKKIENFTVPMHAFCHLAKGELSIVTADGKTMTVKEGDRWVDPKGTLYKVIENKGKATVDDVMFMLAEAEQAEKQ
jgi:copper chaperone CopZ